MSTPQPLSDNIVVIEDEETDLTESGLLLPDSRRKQNQSTGTVVAVGPGRLFPDYTYSHIGIKTGDKVVFGRLSGVQLNYENQKYLVLSAGSVMAVIHGEEATPNN